MKHLLSLLFLFAFVAAQSQTTEEEYNYVTKGLKIQLESGLDMKRGYRIEEVSRPMVSPIPNVAATRSTHLSFLYREGDETPCALIVRLTRSDTEFDHYLCVPHANSNMAMWERAKSDFLKVGQNWPKSANTYFWNTLKSMSYMFSGVE